MDPNELTYSHEKLLKASDISVSLVWLLYSYTDTSYYHITFISLSHSGFISCTIRAGSVKGRSKISVGKQHKRRIKSSDVEDCNKISGAL